jgi:hypothetical protein
VRVGRAPLDEDAIRLIEEHHPHIRFDWPQILKGEQESLPPAPAPRAPREPEGRTDAAAPETVEASEPPLVDEPVSPAHARLGSEGLARLRARYAQVQAALSRRVADEAKREQLKVEAERLNPDGWVTDDEVSSGLEQYEAVLASLRDVIGRRRRRKGRRPRPEVTPGTGAEQGSAGEPTDDESGGRDDDTGSEI